MPFHPIRHQSFNPLVTLQDTDELLLVGWREWIALPELGVDRLVAKLDSGATVSSLHAERIQEYSRGKDAWVRFGVTGEQDQTELCQAKLVGYRNIRSSNGLVESRPVIETILYIAGFQWPIEVTLSNRESLECRMLIGRSALAGRCLVDCGRTNVVSR
ncbi:MAG: RimK/LysX family protein [Pirellula sp.]